MPSNDILNMANNCNINPRNSSKTFIVLEVVRPLCKLSNYMGINVDFLLKANDHQPTEIPSKPLWKRIKAFLFNKCLLFLNLALQLTTIALVITLLHALWSKPKEHEVLDYLTFVEINAATISQGIICYIFMVVEVNRFGHHVERFENVNSLYESCEGPLKQFSRRFMYCFTTAFVIQTVCWIIIVTINYPTNHPVLSEDASKWTILVVIYFGIVSLMVTQYLFQSTYLLFVYILGEGFQSLNSRFETILNSAQLRTSTDDDAWLCNKLFQTRQLYQYSFELSLKNDQLFSPTLLTGLLANTVIAAVSFFQMIVNLVYEFKTVQGILLGATGLVSLCWISALCIIPHSTASKAAKCLTAVFSTSLPSNYQMSQSELKIIAIKISGPPLTITASEFLTLNRSSFTQIVGGCLTYVIGMLQFRQDQLK
ncbi:hypothetical protein CHUAL_013300 [Chamberlinius hualienensis]